MLRDSYDISIVVPSFNKQQYIKTALESILSQDGVNIQMLIYDAGSTDGSWEVIRSVIDSPLGTARIAQGWDIQAKQEKDRGQSHAINKGLIASQGNIVAWLNADDFYHANALITVKKYFADNPNVGLAYGELDFVNANGTLIKRRRTVKWNRSSLLNSYCFVPQPATFWRSELITVGGLLDVSLHFAMDYDYWLRLSRFTEVGQINNVLASIRIMEGTKTGTSPLNAMPEALRVSRRHGARYFSKFRLAYWLWRIGAEGLVRFLATRISR